MITAATDALAVWREGERLLEQLEQGTDARADVARTVEAMRALYHVLTDPLSQPMDDVDLRRVRIVIEAARRTVATHLLVSP